MQPQSIFDLARHSVGPVPQSLAETLLGYLATPYEWVGEQFGGDYEPTQGWTAPFAAIANAPRYLGNAFGATGQALREASEGAPLVDYRPIMAGGEWNPLNYGFNQRGADVIGAGLDVAGSGILAKGLRQAPDVARGLVQHVEDLYGNPAAVSRVIGARPAGSLVVGLPEYRHGPEGLLGDVPPATQSARIPVERYAGDVAYRADPDDFVYHVTTEPKAKRILEEGFNPKASKTVKGGFYENYSKDKVFFTDKDGLGFWRDRIEEHLDQAMDNPPGLVVLRVRKSDMPGLQVDEVGTKDARAKSYFLPNGAMQKQPGLLPAAGKAQGLLGDVPPASGFDSWRKSIWDDVMAGKFHPEETVPLNSDILAGKAKAERLFRAMSDAELDAAQKAGVFRPLRDGDPDLYVTPDPDRLSGGAYGAKGGGYIVEFDPVDVHKATGRLIDVDEIAATEIPYEKVRKIWKWNPETKDHVLTWERGATSQGLLPDIPPELPAWMPRSGDFEEARKAAMLPPEQGGLGLGPANTAAERAQAMSFTRPATHVTNADIESFDIGLASPTGKWGQAIYAAEEAKKLPLLERAVETRAKTAAGLNDMPLMVKMDSPYDALEKGLPLGQVSAENMARLGYDGVQDVGSLAIFNPANIRSRFAAFNPLRRTEADLLASWLLPAAGLSGILGYLGGGDGYQ